MHPNTEAASAPVQIRLRVGQTYRLWSARDAMIIVLTGRIRLHSVALWNPHWLPVWQTSLQTEEHYLLAQSGWLHITVERDCELLYYAPPRTGMLALLHRIVNDTVGRAWRVWNMRQF